MITYEYRLPHDINSFRRSVGWYELSPRQLNCALKSSVFAITALDGEKEVGSARVVGDGGYQFFISDVIVRPEYQGQGIGREMLSRLMDKALSVADVTIEAQVYAREFYEKLGFMRRPNDERGCGMTRFLKK